MAKPVLFIVTLPIEEDSIRIALSKENQENVCDNQRVNIDHFNEEEDQNDIFEEDSIEKQDGLHLKANLCIQRKLSEGYQLKSRFEEIMKRRKIRGNCVWFMTIIKTGKSCSRLERTRLIPY